MIHPFFYDVAHLLAGGMVFVNFIMLYQTRMPALLNVFSLHALMLASSVAWEGWSQHAPQLFITAAIALIVKAIVIPLAFVAEALYAVLSSIGIVLPPPMTADEAARLLPTVEEYAFDEIRGGLLALGILWALLTLLALIVMRTWLRRRSARRCTSTPAARSLSSFAASSGLRSGTRAAAGRCCACGCCPWPPRSGCSAARPLARWWWCARPS